MKTSSRGPNVDPVVSNIEQNICVSETPADDTGLVQDPSIVSYFSAIFNTGLLQNLDYSSL